MNFYVQVDPNAKYVWLFVYFHGDLALENDARWNDTRKEEDWCAPDLVASGTPLDKCEVGIHPCQVYGEECRLYLWGVQTEVGSSKRGLIVRLSDEKAVEWACAQYDQKARSL